MYYYTELVVSSQAAGWVANAMLRVLIHPVKEVQNTQAPITATNSSPLPSTQFNISPLTPPALFSYGVGGHLSTEDATIVNTDEAYIIIARIINGNISCRDPRSPLHASNTDQHIKCSQQLRLHTLITLPTTSSCVLIQLLAQLAELIASSINSYLSLSVSVSSGGQKAFITATRRDL